MFSVFRDIGSAVTALSRLGKTQLIIVFVGTAITVVLSGICTSWGGSAFYATLAFLLCDMVNAFYSITYENSYAFTSLALLLVEQNVVLTASSGLGILEGGPSWAPSSLPWITVAIGWAVLVTLLAMQLALRREWGWHAHKLGLARTEDVALYQRILQLEGAVLFDFCQMIPCTVVVIGKYGFTTTATSKNTDSRAPAAVSSAISPLLSTTVANSTNGNDAQQASDGLGPVISILFLTTAIISALCAPLLATTARRENAAIFTAGCTITVLATAAMTFATTDALRREWPPSGSDVILVSLVIITCISRIIFLAAMARANAIFGSGIGLRISRSSDGAALISGSFEGWSECHKRSQFGGHTSNATGHDTEGANILIVGTGHLDDDGYSDTGSDVGAGSSHNFMYGAAERVSYGGEGGSSLANNSGYSGYGTSAQQQHMLGFSGTTRSSIGGGGGGGPVRSGADTVVSVAGSDNNASINRSVGGADARAPSFGVSGGGGGGSVLSATGGGGGGAESDSGRRHMGHNTSGDSMRTLEAEHLADTQQQGYGTTTTPRTISFVRANRGRMPVSPNLQAQAGKFPSSSSSQQE